jgi:N-acetylmuramoyl-L-alanine amidase
MILASALLCMSLNIFFEARGEPVIGQYAVAEVTMNRADGDPSKVCEVVLKPRQFSWTGEGRLANTKTGVRLRNAISPKDATAWTIATRVAYTVLAGKMIDITRGATYFHATRVKPMWRKRFVQTVAIGNHIFYRDT